MQTQDLLGELKARAAGAPRALPPGLYLDPAILALEQRRLFARDWLCVGRADELPAPGHYLTYEAAGQPIVTLMGRDGAIRSFSNVCRHRMMTIAQGRGRAPTLTCPYHAWSYGLDGRLIKAPHMERTPGFEPRDICLPELRTEIWQGWIYVTLDQAAQPLAALLAPLAAVTAPYAQEGYRTVATQDFTWATNWKLLTENFMEGYHLPVAHRRTVGAWFPAEETGFPAERFSAFTYQTFIKDQTARYGLAHRDNTRLEGNWRHTSVMPTVFPGHMYVLAPDHLWYLSLRPTAVGEVAVRFGFALAPEVEDALADREGFVAETLAFFDRVNDEDKGIVQGIWRALQAPHAAPGPLSWLEREIADFHAYLAGRLAA